MAAANRLKVALEEGKAPAMGCWQMIPGSNVSRVLARTGVDWVLVDCEHGNMDGEWGLCFTSAILQPPLRPIALSTEISASLIPPRKIS
jgi:2-keto-3-deoxy-L-rhamnonate aldolase RhmA